MVKLKHHITIIRLFPTLLKLSLFFFIFCATVSDPSRQMLFLASFDTLSLNMAERKCIWIPYKEPYCVSLDVESQRITHFLCCLLCLICHLQPISSIRYTGWSQSCVHIKRLLQWNIHDHWESVWTFVQSQKEILGLIRFPQWCPKLLQVLHFFHCFFLISFYFILSIFMIYVNN